MAGEAKARSWLAASARLGEHLGGRDTYARAVEAVATVLRPRFESGELRGWVGSDGDRLMEEKAQGRKWAPPLWRVERACGQLFIRTPEAAIFVLRCASRAAKAADPWNWRAHGEASLLDAAETAMSRDVLAYAKRQGWTRPASTPARRRRAA